MLNPIEIIDKNGTLTPWSVCAKRPEGNPYWNPGYTVHGHNKRVAEVANHYFPETAIVVANMIAAAPSMYVALQRLVNAWAPEPPGTDYDAWMEAKAALAKARGENES